MILNRDNNSGHKLLEAIALSRKYEACLRPYAHIALTGSTLYGMGEGVKDDIDFVIYPHGSSTVNETILRHLPVTISRHGIGSGSEDNPHRVMVCIDNATGRRVDFFIFNQ